MSEFSHIDQARPEDNAALLELSRSAVQEGAIGLCIERAPDFFALNRLEGDPWWVWVARDVEGQIMGCASQALRKVYLNGRPAEVIYTSDLKVSPRYRGSEVAQALIRHTAQHVQDYGNGGSLAFLSVLEGNLPMERRAWGKNRLPVIKRCSSFDIRSIPVLWPRRPPHAGTHCIRRATPDDLPEMLELWQRFAPGRQLAPVLDTQLWQQWLRDSPGLDWSDYLLVTDGRDTILGFAAFWEQSLFKQTRITSYGLGLRWVRKVVNLLAPLMGAPGLPPEGGQLKFLSALHFCVADSDVRVAQSLLWAGYEQARGQGQSFLSVGMDRNDELIPAFKGFFPQDARVHVYGARARGEFDAPYHEAPVHFEIALV